MYNYHWPVVDEIPKLYRKATIKYIVDILLFIAIAAVFTFFAVTAKKNMEETIFLFAVGPWIVVIARIFVGRDIANRLLPVAVPAVLGIIMLVICCVILIGDPTEDGEPLPQWVFIYYLSAFAAPIVIYVISGIYRMILVHKADQLYHDLRYILGNDRDRNIAIMKTMNDEAYFIVDKYTSYTAYRTEDVTVDYNREVPVYGNVRSTVSGTYDTYTVTTRGVTGTKTVTDKIKVGERQVEYTDRRSTRIILTFNLNEAVKAYDNTVCADNETKVFTVNYYWFRGSVRL